MQTNDYDFNCQHFQWFSTPLSPVDKIHTHGQILEHEYNMPQIMFQYVFLPGNESIFLNYRTHQVLDKWI